MKTVIKKRKIGYSYNGVNYTWGAEGTQTGSRLGMLPYPPYVLLSPSKDIHLIHEHKSSPAIQPYHSYRADGGLRYIANQSVIDLLKGGYTLLDGIWCAPSAEPIIEDYNVDILPTTDGKSFELRKEDHIILTECDEVVFRSVIDNNCLLILDGDNMRHVTQTIMNRQSDTYCNEIPALYNYRVSAPFGVESDEKTFTDIGGHYLEVRRNNQQAKIVQLHNGFGDGRYTLRFRGNSLVR